MLSVFVVEDALSIRDRLVAMLSDLPRVKVAGVASTADEACKGVAESRPDVVLLDLGLKNSSGFTVLPEIKKLDPPPYVVVLSNYAEGAYRDRAALCGADKFFDKSLEFLDAVGLIEEMGRRSSKGTDPQMVPLPGPAA